MILAAPILTDILDCTAPARPRDPHHSWHRPRLPSSLFEDLELHITAQPNILKHKEFRRQKCNTHQGLNCCCFVLMNRFLWKMESNFTATISNSRRPGFWAANLCIGEGWADSSLLEALDPGCSPSHFKEKKQKSYFTNSIDKPKFKKALLQVMHSSGC